MLPEEKQKIQTAVTRTWIAAMWQQSKNARQWFCDQFLKRPLLTVSRSFMTIANSVL
jgi:hypothetical protein